MINIQMVLPEGLMKLGSRAFEGCSSLQSILVPPMIQVINQETFRECSGLTKVILPRNLQRINRFAFFLYESLPSIDLPPALKVVESFAFHQTGLTELNLPDSVEERGSFYISKSPIFVCHRL